MQPKPPSVAAQDGLAALVSALPWCGARWLVNVEGRNRSDDRPRSSVNNSNSRSEKRQQQISVGGEELRSKLTQVLSAASSLYSKPLRDSG